MEAPRMAARADLPQSYQHDEGPHRYITNAIAFLEKYRWVYDFKLTDFLINQQWKHIPGTWLSTLLELKQEELNQLPYGYIQDEWDPSFQDFLRMSQNLSLNRVPSEAHPAVVLSRERTRGMTPKKQHEVSHMAAVVGESCRQTGCQLVIDVGAGLGYLGQVLSQEFGLKVLGLECEESRTHGADKRAKKQDVEATHLESITFRLSDTPESLVEFQKILQQHIKCDSQQSLSTTNCTPSRTLVTELSGCRKMMEHDAQNCDIIPVRDLKNNDYSDNTCDKIPKDLSNDELDMDSPADSAMDEPKCEAATHCNTAEPGAVGDIGGSGVCLVGLHCCGPLTPTMLKVAARIPEIRALVCVSCCYHAMPVTDGVCTHFPMSEAVHGVLQGNSAAAAGWRISTFALRLSSQETRARWRNQSQLDHDFHTKNVAYRSLLELWVDQQGIDICKQHRKLVPRKHYNDFENYLDAVLRRTTLTCDDGSARETLLGLYAQYNQVFKLIEPFTALQVCLQPVLESLLLVDRSLYLQEQSLQPCILPIFDEMISPRNMAIVITK